MVVDGGRLSSTAVAVEFSCGRLRCSQGSTAISDVIVGRDAEPTEAVGKLPKGL